MAHLSHEKRENTLCKKKKKTLNVNDVDNQDTKKYIQLCFSLALCYKVMVLKG